MTRLCYSVLAWQHIIKIFVDMPALASPVWHLSRTKQQIRPPTHNITWIELTAHLDYVSQPCDIRHMTIWSLFKNGLGTLKTKFPPFPLPGIPPPDFVLRGPNPH